MKAMFNTVKDFAIFNAKPHLFTFGEPYQIGGDTGKDGAVFVELRSGCKAMFASRVDQFGGVVLAEVA